MKLSLHKTQIEAIKEYLFKDSRERMIIAVCRKSPLGVFRIVGIYFPYENDYSERTAVRVTLRAESAYPLIKQIRSNHALSFLQIHSHPAGYPAKFSPVDDRNNGFNTLDVREWNPKADFLRMVLSGDDVTAEIFDYRKKVFRPIDISIRGI